MSRNTSVSRRELLRRSALAGLALPASGWLASCAWTDGSSEERDDAGKPASADNPLGFDETKGVEIVIFNGGLGVKYATDIHIPMLEKRHPGLKVTHSGTREISKVVQPRINAGNPPDVVQNSGAAVMDYGALVDAHAVADLTPLLDAPSWDDPKVKVRDLLLPEAVVKGTYNGTFHFLWYAFTTFGLYYDQSAFTRHGWQVPTTWDQFRALCETIKKSGTMAPFTYAGKYPSYMFAPIMATAAKAGGENVLKALDNLEDEAWMAPEVVQSATLWQEIAKHYLMEGTTGLDHIQTQSAQNRGEVAMLPCGSWIENEQKDHIKGDFAYGVMPVPGPPGENKLPPEALNVDPTMAFLVCANSKNPRAGMEYLRAMISKEGAGKFAQLVNTVTTVKDAAEGFDLKPGARSAAERIKAAGKNRFVFRWPEWYGALREEGTAATGRLMAADLTPAAWAERMQRAADKVKKDPEVKKQTRQ